MKIVYVAESLELSGGVKVIVEQAEGLARRGHDVSIVTKIARHDWIPIAVPILEVPYFDAATLPSADVHVATWFPTVVPTVQAGRAPRVFHLSQGYEAQHPYLEHRAEEIRAAYEQDVPKLLVSAHLLPLLAPRFPGPYHVLGQSVRACDFAPKAGGDGNVAPRVPGTVGVVGPFESPTKGIDVAIDAVGRLRAGGRAVRLHRVSQFPRSSSEAAIPVRCDRYDVALPASGMPAWYARLDLLLHAPYDAEGFPLPPLEAMASGVPIIVTAIPSFAAIPDAAVARVPEGDAEAMAAEASRLLDDPALWRERRRRGLAAAALFSPERVLDRLEAVLSGQKMS